MINEILKNLTLEEAKKFIYGYSEAKSNTGASFVSNGKIYVCPSNLLDSSYNKCFSNGCKQCWINALEKYYKDNTWNEPKIEFKECVVYTRENEELKYFDGVCGLTKEEIKKTKARIIVERFIELNSKIISSNYNTKYEIRYQDGHLTINPIPIYTNHAGTIYCNTRELADEVVSRYPEELKIITDCGLTR